MSSHPLARLLRARVRVAKKAKLLNQSLFSTEDLKHPLASTQLSGVKEIYIAGGGGAGRALPSALAKAQEYGLNFDNIKVVCATSVGTIVGLGITLNIAPHEMKKMLSEMPTNKFQDWNLRRIIHFFSEWGFCSGNEIKSYIRKMIKDKSGLDDPTFLELYQAGFNKEFRVVTTNVSKHKIAIFSHRLTPHQKVADIITTACSIPLVYAPSWIVNDKGELEAHTDGGLIKNYPFGVGASSNVPIQSQLGFNFMNKGAAYAIDNESHTMIYSFWRYFKSLISLVVFDDPLSVSESIQERTVVISVNHNPLKFDASVDEQAALDKAGSKGVEKLVERLLENNERNESIDEHFSAPLLFSSNEKKPAPLNPQGPRRSPRLNKCH